jgi:hypothetical protein
MPLDSESSWTREVGREHRSRILPVLKGSGISLKETTDERTRSRTASLLFDSIASSDLKGEVAILAPRAAKSKVAN